MVKNKQTNKQNLPPMLETLVGFLSWEDLPQEGNGNPLQYSCPENSIDNHGVTKESDTTEQLTLKVKTSYIFLLRWK